MRRCLCFGLCGLLGLLGLLVVGCSTNLPVPQTPEPRSELFVFHSDEKINLHHFLYQWAKAEEAEAENRRYGVTVKERSRLGKLSAGERKLWTAAIDLYKRRLIQRSLLFDAGMRTLRDHLAGKAPLPEAEADAVAALDSVLPAYRRHWWAAHDAGNRRWIAAALPKAQRFEKQIAARVAAALGGTWPAEPVRVDVSAYVTDLGAYATDEPHITMISTDPGYQGWWSLEMLFHEASHGASLSGPMIEDLQQAFAAQGAKVPRDLLHVFIFYTAGEVTRSALQAAGTGGYATYAEQGLWERIPPWNRQREVLQEHWRPYLSGTVERDKALAGIVAALK